MKVKNISQSWNKYFEFRIQLMPKKSKKFFFTNIDSFGPKLQLFEIKSRKKISDSFINSFHSMKMIQKVIHKIVNNKNETILTKCWYFGKTLFEVKASSDGKNVIEVGNNCGLVCT